MILKLLRTDLRSEGMLILLASAASVLMWLSETALRHDDQSATFATLIYGQLPFLVLIAVIAVRRLTQKRGRLLAQLPVTGTPVRMASWLSYLVVVAIACLISAVMLIQYPINVKDTPVTVVDAAFTVMGSNLIAALGGLMVAMITAIVALARISHRSASIPQPGQFLVPLGCFLGCVLLYSQWILFASGGGPFRADIIVQADRIIHWDLLATAALGTAFALVVADILIDRLADNHLR